MKYDVWLQLKLIDKCNLKCEYCSARQYGLVRSSLNPIDYLPYFFSFFLRKLFGKNDFISADIDPFVSALDKSGKAYIIGLTGGEPFLFDDIVRLSVSLTRKHHLFFTSNFTVTQPLRDFADAVDPGRVRQIVASLHIKELESKGLLNTYIDNFNFMRNRGFNVGAGVVAYPPLAQDIEMYREFFSKHGITFWCVPFCGFYKGKLYPDSYTDAQIKSFAFDPAVRFSTLAKGVICNAGYNICVVSPDGHVQPCYLLSESMGNIYKEIKFKNNLVTCRMRRCACCLKNCDSLLFEKALAENKGQQHA